MNLAGRLPLVSGGRQRTERDHVIARVDLRCGALDFVRGIDFATAEQRRVFGRVWLIADDERLLRRPTVRGFKDLVGHDGIAGLERIEVSTIDRGQRHLNAPRVAHLAVPGRLDPSTGQDPLRDRRRIGRRHFNALQERRAPSDLQGVACRHVQRHVRPVACRPVQCRGHYRRGIQFARDHQELAACRRCRCRPAAGLEHRPEVEVDLRRRVRLVKALPRDPRGGNRRDLAAEEAVLYHELPVIELVRAHRRVPEVAPLNDILPLRSRRIVGDRRAGVLEHALTEDCRVPVLRSVGRVPAHARFESV